MKKTVLAFILLTIQIVIINAQELDTLQGFISDENIYVIKPTILNGVKTNQKSIKLQFDSSKININPPPNTNMNIYSKVLSYQIVMDIVFLMLYQRSGFLLK